MTAVAAVPARRIRRAGRVLLTDPAGRVLLFRFTPADRPPFWCTAGGECEPEEDFAAAAKRELAEETGIIADPGPMVARRDGDFVTLAGEPVSADEHFFHVETRTDTMIDTGGHTAQERALMRDYRWFTPAELADWPEPIYPADLAAMLAELRAATPI